MSQIEIDYLRLESCIPASHTSTIQDDHTIIYTTFAVLLGCPLCAVLNAVSLIRKVVEQGKGSS